MERTFFTTFCRANNLIAALEDPKVPEFLRPLFPSILRATAGSTACDVAQDHCQDTVTPCGPSTNGKITPLSPSIYTALLQCLASDPCLSEYTYYRSTQSLLDLEPDTPVLSSNAQINYAITHRGRRFSDASHSVGDSVIMFYSEQKTSLTTRKSFGQIHQIFNHKRRLRSGKFLHQTFLALKVYLPLCSADAHLDPYIDLHVGARLVYAALTADTVVIPLNNVICHAAMCPFESLGATSPSRPCSVVVALDEVTLMLMDSSGFIANKHFQGFNLEM